MGTIPRWVMELRIEVERLVEQPQTGERFREMIRDWSKAVTGKLHADLDEFRKRVERLGVTSAADGEEASPLRFPLPVGIQKPSLQEQYVALAMIHDALNEPAHQLNPWQDIQDDSTVDPFAFVVRFKLDHNVPQFEEVFPESAEPLLRIALEAVKNDLKEMFPASDERREDPVDLAGAESGVKTLREQAGEDGPSGISGFQWKGKRRAGLPAKPLRLLRYLWDATNCTASFLELAKGVWDDEEINLRDNDSRLGSARREINRFMESGPFPFRVQVDMGNELVALIESSAPVARPKTPAKKKKRNGSPRPARAARG